MPALDNPKHERFAQLISKGMGQAEAYAECGYKPSDANASTLRSNQKVSARIAEILDRAAVRTEISVASITERLLKLADKAELSDEASSIQAARACLVDAAKLNGLIVDKSKVDLAATVTEVRRTIVDPRNTNS